MVLKADLAERITDELSARPEILEAYLFGSQARGAGQAHSDVDIAVYVDEEKIAPRLFGVPGRVDGGADEQSRYQLCRRGDPQPRAPVPRIARWVPSCLPRPPRDNRP